jgi:hypothetical protein
MDDRHRAFSGSVHQTYRMGDARAICYRPLPMVDERPVDERGLLRDQRGPLGDEGGQTEILAVTAPAVVAHRPGITRQELTLMVRQRAAYVVEEVGPLRQRPFTISKVGPAAQSWGARDFL